MCSDCNRATGFGSREFFERAEIAGLLDKLAVRIASPEPLRECDSADWDWRAFVARRA